MASRSRNADWIALGVVALLGVPLVYATASAFADGEVRRREAPLRAFLGSQEYEALVSGAETPQHYMGNDRRIPSFELPMADGTRWNSDEHRGKVIVLNFWTVTCQPCMEEMPSLISLSRILADREDIELVTISVDRDWDTVRSVVPDDSSLTVLLDPEREIVNERFGTRLFPETWVIDGDGVIRLRVDGRRDWSSAVALDIFESYL